MDGIPGRIATILFSGLAAATPEIYCHFHGRGAGGADFDTPDEVV